MTRRGHGEGSIYKRQDGRWAAAVDLGWKDGNRKRKAVYGRTRREVADKLRDVQVQADQGLPIADDRLTVGEYLTWWLTDSLPGTVRHSTLVSYEAKVRLHLIPDLGHVRLARLSPAQVNQLLNAKLAEGQSPRSVQYIHAVLRRALGQAERWGMVARNVAKLVSPPKVTRRPVRYLTPDQARQFLDVTSGDRLHALYAVAVSLGLRQGEALGLAWADVDLDESQLRVRHQLQRVDGEFTLTEPKSARSRRTIALPSVCVDALRQHRTRQLQERLSAGDEWENAHDLVFTTRKGHPTDARNLVRSYKRLLAEAGLPDFRFHDLRHTCATLLLAQGVPTRVVMEVLGHSQMSLTTDTYQHVLPSLQQDAADRMDAVFQADESA